MDKWEDLSMKDRAEYIRLGVQNGIRDLDSIREVYNSYANGGSFRKWRKAIKEHKNLDIKHDPEYDYRGYYRNNPDQAWDILNKDSDAHFTDEFKTFLHPTFSNESRYSGYKNKYNPEGIVGGRWIGNDNYVLSKDQFDKGWNTDRTMDYLAENEKIPVTVRDPYGAEIIRSITVKPLSENTPQSLALKRSRTANRSNTNFMHAQDLPLISRLAATIIPRVTNSSTCLNTVTGFYDPNNTVAGNYALVTGPEKYGYKEIEQSDVIPGDLIILSNNQNHPVHAVMFDSIADKNGTHNGYPVLRGDTLVNYSNGNRGRKAYRLQGPLTRFDDPNYSGGDFSGPHRYFRYIGKNSKK